MDVDLLLSDEQLRSTALALIYLMIATDGDMKKHLQSLDLEGEGLITGIKAQFYIGKPFTLRLDFDD